jgi:sugar phosphate isomerase/epimerase
LRTRHDISLQDSIREVKTQIDNARMLSLEYVLSFGADKPEEYQHYFTVMKAAASYAQDRHIKLAMKPHGGISGSSTEILKVLQEVNHPNFSIWYDAGNIVYYTGKDPVSEISPIARHITGFCVKDCGKMKGDVMIQFGEGIVDFNAVFQQLKSARFRGPMMIECCKVGATPAETTENAVANRKYLEKILASL